MTDRNRNSSRTNINDSYSILDESTLLPEYQYNEPVFVI